jgi:hypothetical protein
MQANERRTDPRKKCAMPLRFRILENELVPETTRGLPDSTSATREKTAPRASSVHLAVFEGETVDLSERGVCFQSRHQFRVGQPIEVYFTLPTELTGRNPEQVRCNARVVHVENGSELHGLTRVGASIERHESLNTARRWDN